MNWSQKARSGGDLADDIASALEANPAAAAFFDTLAQFYRKAYLRWIDATTRRPEVRAARIAEVVELLAAGIKERPRRVTAAASRRRAVMTRSIAPVTADRHREHDRQVNAGHAVLGQPGYAGCSIPVRDERIGDMGGNKVGRSRPVACKRCAPGRHRQVCAEQLRHRGVQHVARHHRPSRRGGRIAVVGQAGMHDTDDFHR